MVPSGSVPEPASVTLAAAATVWSGPALAVGFWFGVAGAAVTLMTTSSVAVPPRLSVTVRRKPSATLLLWLGAVKVGLAALALLSVTVVPEVCVQAKLAMVPSGSVPEPASVTLAAEATV